MAKTSDSGKRKTPIAGVFPTLSHCKGERFVLLLMDTVKPLSQLEMVNGPNNGLFTKFCMLSAADGLGNRSTGSSEGYSAPA